MFLSKEARVIQTLFQIQNKQGTRVPFNLNPAQLQLDSIKHNRRIIAKARQMGFSAYILANKSVKCLGKEGTHAVCMSHEAGATQRLLDRVHYYMKHLKGPQPDFGRHSRSELYFNKTDSSFYIGTAGAKSFGRGDTVTDLHCSEYAFWDNPESHQTGIFQCVPITGNIDIESTGNGRNNDFFYMWSHAKQLGYEKVFRAWYQDPDYLLIENVTWKPDCPGYNDWLLDIRNVHKLNDNQMRWFEWKFKSLREDLKMMNQEYPSTPDDCFQATGGALFPNVLYLKSNNWETTKDFGYYCNILRPHPVSNYTYVIGADPSGGTGNDDAGMVIFCCETGEQVLEFAVNTVQPLAFAEFIIKMGLIFNEAYLVPECNNHGVAVVEYLTKHYKRTQIYKYRPATRSSNPKYGWLNTKSSKHQLVDLMQVDLLGVELYGKQTVNELLGFEETDEGKMGGKSDNLVIACGLGLLGLSRFAGRRGAHLIIKPHVELKKRDYMTYTLDEVLDGIDNRKMVRSYG